jgi:predicted DNA-binding transcriptional regulator YafY
VKATRQQDYLFAQLRRQLWIHRETLSGRYPNCTSAADALRVSTKTIQRDIAAMIELGLRLKYDPARFGYIYQSEQVDPVELFIDALLKDPLAPPDRAPLKMPESEKSLWHVIGEYDPAKSAEEFLKRYLGTRFLPSSAPCKTS